MGATPKPPLLSVGDSFPAPREGEALGFSDLTAQSKGKTRMEEEEGGRTKERGEWPRRPCPHTAWTGPGSQDPSTGRKPKRRHWRRREERTRWEGRCSAWSQTPPPRALPLASGVLVLQCTCLLPVQSGRGSEEGPRGGERGRGREDLDVQVSLGLFRQSYYQNANQLQPGQFAYSMLCSLKRDEYA